MKPSLPSAPALASFKWDDPFLIEADLTEDARMIRDAAHAYAQDELLSCVTKAFANEGTDPEIFREMGETGLLGTTIPDILEEFGGIGFSYVSYGLVAHEIERVDSGYRLMMSVQSSLVMCPIYAFGTEERYQKYLPKLASDTFIGCFGLTEPDAGSDPAGMTTVVQKTDGRYVLNGSKMWVSTSAVADALVVWAKSEACWHAARQYGLDQRQFDRPLAQTQLFQLKLANMQTEITLGLYAALRVGRLMDEARTAPKMVSLIKRNNCGKALDIARHTRDRHRGNGISQEFHEIHNMVNLETVNTYQGTHDVHALILGRAQTGLQVFV
ncbi:MAG: acyl-CoA dehydrogenase family protein [Aestuariivita sp.]|nr:acyl-CoA dehydrogenase family protein [Aestuariivita sp.]MCY4203626.1 acyl-CoA dehydrogenase family protein [Aestuariivita sp.]